MCAREPGDTVAMAQRGEAFIKLRATVVSLVDDQRLARRSTVTIPAYAGRVLVWPAGESLKLEGRRNGEHVAIVAPDNLPFAFVNHPVMPMAEGLLPNSSKRSTIGVPSFPARVAAGGAALDGVQSGRAEALPELLTRRSRSRQAHRPTLGRCSRFWVRTQPRQPALQPHRATFGRPRGAVQALAARLPLQYS